MTYGINGQTLPSYDTSKKPAPTLRSRDVVYNAESPIDYYEYDNKRFGFNDTNPLSTEKRAEYNELAAAAHLALKQRLEAQEAVDRERDELEKLQAA